MLVKTKENFAITKSHRDMYSQMGKMVCLHGCVYWKASYAILPNEKTTSLCFTSVLCKLKFILWQCLKPTIFSNMFFVCTQYVKNLVEKIFVDYLHSLLFFPFVHTSISTVIKNSLKFNFSLGNNFHIICIFTAPWKIFSFFFIPRAKTVFAIAGNSANFFFYRLI